MGGLSIIQTNVDDLPPLEDFSDATIFQTAEWVRFVAACQNAQPIFAAVKDGDRTVGRFTGLVVKKFGMRILGSPFPGWTTSYMGFNLLPEFARKDALAALRDFAFRSLKCVHLEVLDRRASEADMKSVGFEYRKAMGFEIDLTRDERDLFAAMKSACQRCVRKADKVGVVIEQAEDMEFVDQYYEQLKDVFAKQNLAPTYSRDRVRALIEYLLPTGRLLLVRARAPDGRCIATGIFPAFNDSMHFWGGASWRSGQHFRPNEAVQWYAMRYWKARGIARYDMGGGGEYKRKYGGREIAAPWGRKSRYALVGKLRELAKSAYTIRQRILGRRVASQMAKTPPTLDNDG